MFFVSAALSSGQLAAADQRLHGVARRHEHVVPLALAASFASSLVVRVIRLASRTGTPSKRLIVPGRCSCSSCTVQSRAPASGMNASSVAITAAKATVGERKVGMVRVPGRAKEGWRELGGDDDQQQRQQHQQRHTALDSPRSDHRVDEQQRTVPAPAVKNVMTKSIESVNAISAPAMTPGMISGSVTNRRRWPATPQSRAARSASRPCRRAGRGRRSRRSRCRTRCAPARPTRGPA